MCRWIIFRDSGKVFQLIFSKGFPTVLKALSLWLSTLNARPLFKWHVFSTKTPIMSQQIKKKHKRRLDDANLNKGKKFLYLFSTLLRSRFGYRAACWNSHGFFGIQIMSSLRVKRNPKSIQILRKDENWCQLCNNLWPKSKKKNQTKQSKTETASCDKRRSERSQWTDESENIFINKFRNFSNFANHLFAVWLWLKKYSLIRFSRHMS